MSLEGHENEGVWVYCGHNDGPYVHSIHAHEIEALREMNKKGYDTVVFVPFGADFNDVYYGRYAVAGSDPPAPKPAL